ncbi:hypothetical protein A7A09_014570 [Paracoccus methylarcula]|uniref:Uncharacterized protein n=1 Tax=Paracoccus methylarcula TaxID=72022 RepID=A0A3R7Q1H4_9RHOB|nr:hypothetical protein A7A09_014570 [Paracoccus methylarcula]
MPAKIDRRFARRFPNRGFWLRPASAEERKIQFRGRSEPGWHPCMAIMRGVGKHADKFHSLPFYSSTPDLADIGEEESGMTAAHVRDSLSDGGLPFVTINRM